MTPPLPRREKMKSFSKSQDYSTMDAERINTISNQLADLSNRVNELRGYL